MNHDTDELSRLRCLDDFLEGDDDAFDIDALRGEVEQARLIVKKARLRDIRATLDRGDNAGHIIPIDRAALRVRLLEAMSNDSYTGLTLAARGGSLENLDTLIDDLAELDLNVDEQPAR